MNKWNEIKLSQLQDCEIVMGQSPPSNSYNTDNGIPFLQGKTEFGFKYPKPVNFTTHPIKFAEEGDLLISVRAPVGDVNISPFRLCIGRGLAALRFRQNNNRFYFYWFQFKKDFIENQGMGSTFKAITVNQIKNLEIPLPPLPEQKAIAEILTTVDDAIQKSDEAIKRTERIKNAMMKKLLTEGIEHSEFKETKIGRIPKEWEVKGINELGMVVTGKTPPTTRKEYWNGNIPFITPGDIKNKKFVSTTERTISLEAAKKTSVLLPINTIMIVCIGSTIGKIGITSENSATNQQINSIILDQKNFDLNFVYYSILKIADKIKSFSGTAAVPIIKKSLFEKLNIPVSKLDEQILIGQILSNIDKRIEFQVSHRDKLLNIKKSLMNDLLTGKKRITMK